MPKTFPFYNPDFDFDRSIVYEVIEKMYNKSVESLNTAFANCTTNTSFQDAENEKISIELADVLLHTIDEIERRLNFETNLSLANVCNEILQSTMRQDTRDKLFDIARDFTAAKDLILNGKEPESNLIDRIDRAVIGEDEDQSTACVFLLTIYTFDPQTIKKYFVYLKQNNMSSKLTRCFRAIGVTGSRHLVNFIIENHLDRYESELVSDIREYTQLFGLFITTLADLPVYRGQLSTRGLIISLLKAAYYDGQITKEREFYSNDSLRVMASIGTSRAMQTSKSYSAKEKLKNEAREEIKSLFKSKTRLSHGDMAKKIIKDDKFSGLKLYLIERMIREEAKNQEACRGNSQRNATD